jgi:aminoglycoside 3-N-acetyltransferase
MLGGQFHDVTPCGENSPYFKLREKAGQILFLGCGLKPNTSMHAVEELVEPPYLYDGWVDYRCHRSLENQPGVVTSKPATLRV